MLLRIGSVDDKISTENGIGMGLGLHTVAAMEMPTKARVVRMVKRIFVEIVG